MVVDRRELMAKAVQVLAFYMRTEGGELELIEAGQGPEYLALPEIECPMDHREMSSWA